MSDRNPYAAPLVTNDEASRDFPPIEVRGQYLLVQSGAQFPRHCVRTNEAVTEAEKIHHVFRWAPSFRPAWSYQRCVLTFYVSQDKQREIRRIRSVGWMMVCGAMLMLALGDWLFGNSLASSATMMAILGIIVLLSSSHAMRYLRIVRFRDGRYWITGLHKDFLETCRAQAIQQQMLAHNPGAP